MQTKDRKLALFNDIIKEYIKTAKPVGSKFLVEKSNIDVSPATVRNDMVDLEKQGLIASPHTSAGIIPTAEGYRFYIDNFLDKNIDLADKYKKNLDDLLKHKDRTDKEQTVKSIAKHVAEVCDEAILVTLADNSFYYTGISNLFRKPEFQDVDLMGSMAEIIDAFDDVMSDLDLQELKILVGEDNPFFEAFSFAATPYKIDEVQGMFGILGPMRMDYKLNYSLLKYIKNV